MNINKKALKGAALVIAAALGMMASCFAIVFAIDAIFESPLWKATTAVAVVVIALFLYTYHNLNE